MQRICVGVDRRVADPARLKCLPQNVGRPVAQSVMIVGPYDEVAEFQQRSGELYVVVGPRSDRIICSICQPRILIQQKPFNDDGILDEDQSSSSWACCCRL